MDNSWYNNKMSKRKSRKTPAASALKIKTFENSLAETSVYYLSTPLVTEEAETDFILVAQAKRLSGPKVTRVWACTQEGLITGDRLTESSLSIKETIALLGYELNA